MQFYKSYFFCALVFILLTYSSCKKEIDNYAPKVIITTPVENQFFNVLDAINVKATVTDETQITSVSISLLDSQYNPAYVSLSLPVTSPSMTINASYPLDNIHLESGSYNLLITASDGKNTSNSYLKIYLGAVPKVLKKVYVSSASNSFQTNLSFIDSAFTTIIPYKNFSGDYIGSSVSSYFQQAYICGYYTGSFTGIRLEDGGVRFSIPPINSSQPYYTGFFSDDKNNYIALYNGQIYGYDYVGNIIFNAVSDNEFFANNIAISNGYLIAEEKQRNSSLKRLVAYLPNGVEYHEIFTLTMDVVSFCEKDNGRIFLFGNSSGQGTFQLFDYLNNVVSNPYTLNMPAGTILSAVIIDSNDYLIGYSDGTIYKYEFQNNTFTSYLTGYTAIKLKYDPVNNEVYVVENNRISSFDYNSKSLHHSINTAEPVLDINLLYNR